MKIFCEMIKIFNFQIPMTCCTYEFGTFVGDHVAFTAPNRQMFPLVFFNQTRDLKSSTSSKYNILLYIRSECSRIPFIETMFGPIRTNLNQSSANDDISRHPKLKLYTVRRTRYLVLALPGHYAFMLRHDHYAKTTWMRTHLLYHHIAVHLQIYVHWYRWE